MSLWIVSTIPSSRRPATAKKLPGGNAVSVTGDSFRRSATGCALAIRSRSRITSSLAWFQAAWNVAHQTAFPELASGVSNVGTITVPVSCVEDIVGTWRGR